MKFIQCILFIWLLSSCQHVTYNQKKTNNSLVTSVSPFIHHQQISGKVAKPIRYEHQQYWLLTSEQQGVLLVDQQGQVLSQVRGNTEILDVRQNIQLGTSRYDLIVTLDNNLGQILILSLDWQTKQLSILTGLPKTDAQIEALCWYVMPQGHMSLFIADTLGYVTQRLVLDANTHSLVNDVLVQTFIGAPQTKSCAVDDVSRALYLAEENIGVWRYSADHESELERELVVASQPFGELEGEISDIEVLNNGDLLVSTPDQQGLWHVNQNEGIPHHERSKFIALNGSIKPESVSALENGSNLLLGIFDGATGVYQSAEIAISLPDIIKQKSTFSSIAAYSQTTPVQAYGDAADDPAIWLNISAPEKSRVLGTNKKQGLMQYNLQGRLLQQLNVGRVNNVDIRYGLQFAGTTIDIAAASNRSHNSISLFAIDSSSGEMQYVSDIPTDIADVYGLCMYQSHDKYYVFINGTDGRFQQYLLKSEPTTISGELVREFTVPSQPEGCVADDQQQLMYFGEESTGVWQISAELNSTPAKLIINTNDTFVADVEGMGIYRYKGQRFLIASSQGNNSYGVFALDNKNQHLGSFAIDMDITALIDGVSETDGLDLISQPLGENLPAGVLVVQDGRNRLPMAPQNFKLVDARQIQSLIDRWLDKH